MPGKQASKHLRWLPPGAGGEGGAGGEASFDIPAHEPPLAPRDEAVFLLHTGAEIEHALLVQYLYAAYSLKSPKEVPQEYAAKVRAWKKTLLGIAREEMGHLITVQNLLRLIGGPLNLEREDYPFRSQLYPFPFRLERLSKGSLAKYVVAEMPYFADEDAYLERLQRLGPKEILHDYANQIIEVSDIYRAKQRLVNLALDHFRRLSILWVVTMLVLMLIVVWLR